MVSESSWKTKRKNNEKEEDDEEENRKIDAFEESSLEGSKEKGDDWWSPRTVERKKEE